MLCPAHSGKREMLSGVYVSVLFLKLCIMNLRMSEIKSLTIYVGSSAFVSSTLDDTTLISL